MSSPPAYDNNPDKRSLPPGWITQYDSNYKAWFYVNTQANPPVTTWNHPLGPVPSPSLPEPPRRYTPPVAAPESYPGRYADGGQGGYPNQNSYPQQPPLGGYGGAEYPQRTERGLGGLIGRFMGRGGRGHNHGGHPSNGGGAYMGRGAYMGGGGGYPAQQQLPPQVVYVEQQPPKKSGIGIGGLAMGVGGGLLAGALLEDAFDGNGNDDYGNDFGNGNDFGDDDNGFF